MNLCFMLVLITILALQRSAAVFAPVDLENETVLGDEFRTVITNLTQLARRSTIIKDWYLENQTSSWERMRLAPAVETDLFEARFHVANAEAVSAATGDTRWIESELDRADGYLQSALKTIANDLRPFVRAIRIELADAKLEIEEDSPDTDIRDEQIKTDMDWLIDAVHDRRGN
jgi:hypothetical protein